MQPVHVNDKYFSRVVSKVLENVYNLLEIQPFNHDIIEKDSVLNYKVPGIGEYVFNKQPPNKQIWVSSPLTGPKRFNLGDNERFYNTITKEELLEYIKKEVEMIKKKLNLRNEV